MAAGDAKAERFCAVDGWRLHCSLTLPAALRARALSVIQPTNVAFTRKTAAWTQAVIVISALALAMVAHIEDRGRADWVGGPLLFFYFLFTFPIHGLASAAAVLSKSRVWPRVAGVGISFLLLVIHVWLFVGYMGFLR